MRWKHPRHPHISFLPLVSKWEAAYERLNSRCWLWCVRARIPSNARRPFVNPQDADISITWSKLRSLFPPAVHQCTSGSWCLSFPCTRTLFTVPSSPRRQHGRCCGVWVVAYWFWVVYQGNRRFKWILWRPPLRLPWSLTRSTVLPSLCPPSLCRLKDAHFSRPSLHSVHCLNILWLF